MGFAIEHIKAASDQLDRVQISIAPSSSEILVEGLDTAAPPLPSARLKHLQSSIDALSVTLATKPALLQSRALIRLLQEAFKSPNDHSELVNLVGESSADTAIEQDLEWVLIGKAAAQTQALVLDALIQKTVPLHSEILYWRGVLDTYPHTALYSLQTSPIRLWKWSKSVYHEVRQREVNVTEGWRKFYSLVRTVMRERSATDVRARIVSPLVLVRGEIQMKKRRLEGARLLNAGGIGYLLSNGINSKRLDVDLDRSQSKLAVSDSSHNWKSVIIRSISVIDALLGALNDPEVSEDSFETSVAACMNGKEFEAFCDASIASQKPLEDTAHTLEPFEAAGRLRNILESHIPSFSDKATKTYYENRRPSRLIRYWLPAVVLLSSSSTILRYLANRKADILDWIGDLGSTLIDFWANWVVEPTKKVIGTIRHDEASEISIMSKRSLEVDRASLERMVVDFATDTLSGSPLSISQIDTIKANIQEGDLTPVLKVYEKELQSPLYGSLRGNLIRALLIQIQKTKVDLEVAMGGIDSLLKSQELVFGFIGLTPGILVSIGLFRWLYGLSNERQSNKRGKKQTQSLLVLRNIDRILTSSSQTESGLLSFKEYGLLVCEALTLRERASRTFPVQAFQDFLQDFDDLIDNHSGVTRQVRVADRIRWAYSRWL